MRIAVDPGRLQADLLHRQAHPCHHFGPREMRFQGLERFGDRLTDRHAGIEARQRILEDDLEIPAQRP
ncbi:hypothetical protein D3C83_143950 [compost metagenome]